MNQDEHPLDAPLGVIHELALALQVAGQTDAAVRLAEAHGAIEAYLLEDRAIEESLLIFHQSCGGMVTGKLDAAKCSECGQAVQVVALNTTQLKMV